MGMRPRGLMAAAILAVTAAGLEAAPAGRDDRQVTAYGKLPLVFEANLGQASRDVRFLSRGPDYGLFLTPKGAVLALRRPESRSELRLKLVGGNPRAQLVGVNELPSYSNYLIGSDQRQWRTGIPHYGRVEYRNAYPGVNLVFHGSQGELEYDFEVASGADPRRIALNIEGARRVDIDAEGNLVLHTADGSVVSRAPVVYQQVGGVKRTVHGRYRRLGRFTIGFALGAYDTRQPVVIDPVLGYSTFLGGAGHDNGLGITVDAAGNAYATGETLSVNFPTTAGTWDTTRSGSSDAFVTKIDAAGTAFVYSTYLGGSSIDRTFAIAVDAAGSAYLTGFTASGDFPTTPGALQTTAIGGGFLTKLDPAGSALEYSTYLLSSGLGRGAAIAVDAAGQAYVAGDATHVTVLKLNAAGSALLYSTTLAGATPMPGAGSAVESASGLALDAFGRAYVTGATQSSDFPTTAGAFQMANAGGADGFVTKLDGAGAIVYSTYLGGANRDIPNAIVVDAAGRAYVTGFTESTNFPTTAGAFQIVNPGPAPAQTAFVTKLDNTGSALVYSTYLGGSANDISEAIAVDAGGRVYVSGTTLSSDFPTLNPFPFPAATKQGFVAKLDAQGAALAYATRFGGPSFPGRTGLALDASANVFVTGSAGSALPVTAGAAQGTNGGFGDAFVMKINAADSAVAEPGGTASASTAPGMSGEAGVSATLSHDAGATADASLITENLSSATSTAGIIDVGGRYVDLRVDGADANDVVTAKFYYPSTVTGANETNLQLLYFTAASTWEPVLSSGGATPAKNTTDNLDSTVSGGRFTVTFDGTSTPKVTELTGTVFTAARLSAPSPTNHDPVAACRDVATSTDPGTCQAASASVDNGSSDPDGDPLTFTQNPGGPYALGNTSVTLTVTDNRGGSDSCQATVTVEDNQAPAISCPAPLILECSGPGGAPASPSATASDNCDTAVVTTCSPSGAFPLGTTEVTCGATDSSGSTSSCQTSVMVSDTKPPSVQCVPGSNPAGNTPNPNAGFYRVSAQDVCSAVAIRIGGYALADGETVKLTQSRGAAGVSLVNTMGSIRHFRVGAGQAVITATDVAGNVGSAVCPVSK